VRVRSERKRRKEKGKPSDHVRDTFKRVPVWWRMRVDRGKGSGKRGGNWCQFQDFGLNAGTLNAYRMDSVCKELVEKTGRVFEEC